MSAQRTEIGVQRRQQFFENSLQGDSLLFGQQTSFIGAAKEMPCLVERPARYSNEPLMIDRRRPSITFGDVCAYTVCGSDKLIANGTLGERLPSGYGVPYEIGQGFRHRINPEFLQREFRHAPSLVTPARILRPITNR